MHLTRQARNAILTFVIVWAVILGTLGWFASQVPAEQRPLTLYYGTGCPHCKIVEDWMDENGFRDKVNITMKEVWSNEKNNAELLVVAKECGIKEDVGIPLLYADGLCYIGDVDVIDVLKEKIK